MFFQSRAGSDGQILNRTFEVSDTILNQINPYQLLFEMVQL